jgi:hypothetical protein
LFINCLENEVVVVVQFSCDLTTLARDVRDTNAGMEIVAKPE